MPYYCTSHTAPLLIVIETFAQFVANFIWLRPGWLMAIPIALLWLWHLSKRQRNAGWQKHISSESLQHLRSSHSDRKYYRYFALPVIIAIIAMAGPALESRPTGAAKSERATVLVLDLSPSMAVRDIQPDRLAQAKFKTIDILRRHNDGEIGLIVYAANAYRVTPLTDDPATIEALVPTLHPDIMPAPGSNVESAIDLAIDMLRESGTQSGAIILITDGITTAGQTAIEENAPGQFRLSVLGVGTEKGDSIPLESGVVTDANQQPVIARLNGRALKQLAQRFDGRYARWTTDSTDINNLLAQKPLRARISPSPDSIDLDGTGRHDKQQFDRYQDMGYWLLLPLLLFAMYAFRRNALLTIGPLFISPLLLVSADAKSHELHDIWRSLWLNNEQQAQALLHQQSYAQAYEMFTRNEWKAIAAYHRGKYIEAAQLLATPVYAEDLYNRGNAQALSGDLQAAIKSYSQALLLYGPNESSERADTLYNINLLKTLVERNDEQSSESASDSAYGDDNRTDGNEEGNGEGNEPPAITDDATPDASDTGSQTRVGGSTGPGQSLDQQSLEENNGVDFAAPANPIQDGTLPTDASERLNAPPGESQQPGNRPDQVVAPQIAEESNLVLSPYSEQWLRDLPQDPGGYLRRKFLFQYQTSESPASESQADDSQPATESTRY